MTVGLPAIPLRAPFVAGVGLAVMTAAGCSSRAGEKTQGELRDPERQRAITYTETFISAGNPPPFTHRVSRATRAKAGLWRVEVTGHAPGAWGRPRYTCFTIRLDRFYVHTTATDAVSSEGIQTTNRRCP